MEQILLDIPDRVQKDMWTHLLPGRFMAEEAAFIYVQQIVKKDAVIFNFLDWSPVQPDGFLSRSEYHFELTDETRAFVIKRAHDLDASLVELHSHSEYLPVEFSATDFWGFKEFVPHVWWRLKGRPYMAVVVSREGIDGLAWIKGPELPLCLNGISFGTQILKTTGLSFNRRYEYYGE